MRLALDTSTRLGSVALADRNGLVAEASFSARADHSETVLSEVERMLRNAGHGSDDLTQVVVGSGPGSFTGVRIAAALAKGLCFARDLPLLAYSSLLAVAAGSGLAGQVCALFDARREEVYAAAYRWLAPPRVEVSPAALPLEELLERLGAREWRFVGEGALRYAAAIEARGGTVLPEPLAHPRASVLLWLAEAFPEAGRVASAADWEPGYARGSGAVRSLGRAG